MPIARVLEMTESPLRKPSNKPRIAWTSRSWMTWMQTLSQMPFEHLLLADFFHITTSALSQASYRAAYIFSWLVFVCDAPDALMFFYPSASTPFPDSTCDFGSLVTFCHRKATICFWWENPLVSSPRRDSAVGSVPCIPKGGVLLGNGRMEYACDMWAYWYLKLLMRGYLWNGCANSRYPHWIMISMSCRI